MLRIELFDIERTIAMNAKTQTQDFSRSPLGHSIGRWEDDTLVVTTTHVSWPYFDQSGVPLGDAAEIVERFRPDAGSGRLHYAITVADSSTFTEPVTLEKYWTWRPGEEIQHFECTEFE